MARLEELSAAFHKYGDAPRAPRRPSRKARGGRIPGVFDRRATPRDGMHRRPNATVFMKVSTKDQARPGTKYGPRTLNEGPRTANNSCVLHQREKRFSRTSS